MVLLYSRSECAVVPIRYALTMFQTMGTRLVQVTYNPMYIRYTFPFSMLPHRKAGYGLIGCMSSILISAEKGIAKQLFTN